MLLNEMSMIPFKCGDIHEYPLKCMKYVFEILWNTWTSCYFLSMFYYHLQELVKCMAESLRTIAVVHSVKKKK